MLVKYKKKLLKKHNKEKIVTCNKMFYSFTFVLIVLLDSGIISFFNQSWGKAKNQRKQNRENFS